MRRMLFDLILISFLFSQCFFHLSCCGFKGLSGLKCERPSTRSYDGTYRKVESINDVKEITYTQFMRIRNSGEKYVLLDVLGPDSYDKGHIHGARSFPSSTINSESAVKMLHEDDRIIVYCASQRCRASTKAAQKLDEMGYLVLDYKGGLEEWQRRGNRLVGK